MFCDLSPNFPLFSFHFSPLGAKALHAHAYSYEMPTLLLPPAGDVIPYDGHFANNLPSQNRTSTVGAARRITMLVGRQMDGRRTGEICDEPARFMPCFFRLTNSSPRARTHLPGRYR